MYGANSAPAQGRVGKKPVGNSVEVNRAQKSQQNKTNVEGPRQTLPKKGVPLKYAGKPVENNKQNSRTTQNRSKNQSSLSVTASDFIPNKAPQPEKKNEPAKNLEKNPSVQPESIPENYFKTHQLFLDNTTVYEFKDPLQLQRIICIDAKTFHDKAVEMKPIDPFVREFCLEINKKLPYDAQGRFFLYSPDGQNYHLMDPHAVKNDVQISCDQGKSYVTGKVISFYNTEYDINDTTKICFFKKGITDYSCILDPEWNQVKLDDITKLDSINLKNSYKTSNKKEFLEQLLIQKNPADFFERNTKGIILFTTLKKKDENELIFLYKRGNQYGIRSRGHHESINEAEDCEINSMDNEGIVYDDLYKLFAIADPQGGSKIRWYRQDLIFDTIERLEYKEYPSNKQYEKFPAAKRINPEAIECIQPENSGNSLSPIGFFGKSDRVSDFSDKPTSSNANSVVYKGY